MGRDFGLGLFVLRVLGVFLHGSRSEAVSVMLSQKSSLTSFPEGKDWRLNDQTDTARTKVSKTTSFIGIFG